MPVYGGPNGTDEADEPGGATCQKCRTDLGDEAHVYREVFGAVDHTTEHGVVFDDTGGVPVRHYCEDCYREYRTRAKAAHFDVSDRARQRGWPDHTVTQRRVHGVAAALFRRHGIFKTRTPSSVSPFSSRTCNPIFDVQPLGSTPTNHPSAGDPHR